jgi:hypothetical protein
VQCSIATLESSVKELTEAASSLIGDLEKVLSLPTVENSTNTLVDSPKPTKAILANSIDVIIESVRDVTAILADAQSRLEI